MKLLAALAIIAVGFALGFGSAHQWLASHPKDDRPPRSLAAFDLADEAALFAADRETPEAAPVPEPARTKPEPEPASPEPELAMDAAAPAPVPDSLPADPVESPALAPIDFDSPGARITGNSPALDEAIAITLESGGWIGYRDHLRSALSARFGGLDPTNLSNLDAATDPLLVRLVLSQERFLSKFPEAVVRPLFAADHEYGRWLLGDADMLAALYHNLGESDDPKSVLTFLNSLHQEMADHLTTYGHLAIACGLVHDYGERAESEATRRFLWYVDQDQKGRLFRDIKSMPVSDLAFVVKGVDLDQMNWVQAKFRRDVPRAKSGRVYGQIKYRMDLVTGDISRDALYPEYTLAAIAENGGVCADQAHFAENVCRALAIPAVKLSGSGNRGAHAWVAYQENDGRWHTFGRYENYANGSFRHPQTRGDASESLLLVRNTAPFRSAARTGKIENRFLVADFLRDSGDLPRATEAAIQIASTESEYVPAWERVFSLLESQKETIAAASAVPIPEANALTADRVVSLIKSFEIALRNQPDMLDRADAVLTGTLDGILEDKALLEILHRRRKRVETYDASRLGTILDLIRQEAAILARSDSHTAVASLYRQELRSYGKDLQFFRKLAASFWDLSKDDPSRRDAALGLLNAEVKSNFERLLEGRDYFAKETAIEIYSQLSDYYRQADKAGRADQLDKKIARAREELKNTKT